MKSAHTILIAMTIVLVSSCNDSSSTSKETETSKTDTVVTTATAPATNAPVVDSAVTTTHKTATGKTFTVTESHPKGASLSNITVKFNGSADSTLKVELNDVDPINKVMTYDLDSDGFEEVYIVTVSAGSGSGAHIYGYASNKDKSMSEIFVPAVEEKDLAKGGNFEGYEGHDQIELVENSLMRNFPIKAPNVTTRSVNYKMKKGEAGYKLVVKNSTAF